MQGENRQCIMKFITKRRSQYDEFDKDKKGLFLYVGKLSLIFSNYLWCYELHQQYIGRSHGEDYIAKLYCQIILPYYIACMRLVGIEVSYAKVLLSHATLIRNACSIPSTHQDKQLEFHSMCHRPDMFSLVIPTT